MKTTVVVRRKLNPSGLPTLTLKMEGLTEGQLDCIFYALRDRKTTMARELAEALKTAYPSVDL